MNNKRPLGTDLSNRQEVETAAKEALCKSGYAELKAIDCQYDACGRTLTLSGRVSVFYSKQIAQEIIRRILHVERIANMIEVEK